MVTTYFVFPQLGKYVRVGSRDLLNLSTHNYLGMVGDSRVEAASIAALRKYGVGACGPRTFFGTVGTAPFSGRYGSVQ